MPDRDEETASETDTLLERSQRKVHRLWSGFLDFAFQGNILQIAFGLMYFLLLLYWLLLGCALYVPCELLV